MFIPDATQLYEHYAKIYGEDVGPEADALVEAPAVKSPPKLRYRRLCGIIPIPFLYSPETKSIAAASSGTQQYGTLVSVGELANNQGYSRLPEESSSTLPSALKRGKSRDTPLAQNAAALAGSASASVRRTKSRDRVAFTPPSVSNLESLKSAQKKAKQMGTGSLSEGEAPRTVPGLPKPVPTTPKQARPKTPFDATSTSHPAILNKTPKQSQGVVYPITTPSMPAQLPQATMTTPAAVSVIDANTASGAPAWISDSERTAAPSSKAVNGTSKVVTTTPATQRSILQRPSGTPTGQVPNGTNVSKTFSNAQGEQDRSSEVAKYVEALTAARTDPVAFLESHTLFNSQKSRKGKTLQYDDSASTPKKCVVQVKVDGKLVAQSAAAGQDIKLAKARAAFKAIDALSVSRYLMCHIR